jgi:hypothetical protein
MHRALVLSLFAVAALVVGAFAYARSGGGPGASAFALVDPNGGSPQLIAAHTRGIVGVTSPSPGDYCLAPAPGVDVVDTAAVASAEAFYSSDIGVATVRYQPGSPSCGVGQLEVKTFSTTTNSPSDEIAFTVNVP